MKREIKFRGIYPHSGQFFYGCFVNAFPDTPRIVSENLSTPIKIETLGQFTGLKDKNGKEIYEGDIIDSGTDEAPEIVEFKDWCYVLTSKGRSHCEFFQYNVEYFEVIGNIYENPNLVK